MEEKARLTILIDPAMKKGFEQLCASQDVTASQVVRMLIRQYVEKNGGRPAKPAPRKTRSR